MPTKQEYTNYGIGTAAGIVFTWVFGLVPNVPDVPGEVGVALGSLFVWLAWKLRLGED